MVMIDRLRVLLLDDSPAERELAEEGAREFAPDIELLTVGTPNEADSGLLRFAPAVVLIDLHLGKWNGLDLLPRLQGSIGSVILTTANDPAEAQRCLAAGALAFWIKPLRYAGFADLFVRIHALAAASEKGDRPSRVRSTAIAATEQSGQQRQQE